MNVFRSLFQNVRVTLSRCACCGTLAQIDATLPDQTPVRIMRSRDGYHVAVGVPGALPGALPGQMVIAEVLRQWLGVRA
jgi:hypothetical protein